MIVSGRCLLWRPNPDAGAVAAALGICAGEWRHATTASRDVQRREWRDSLASWPELREHGLRLEPPRPGEPARWESPHAGAPVSISHAAGVSIAAWIRPDARWHGLAEWRIGVDVVALADVPTATHDLDAMATAYMGPDAARALAAVPSGARPAAFARAWATHEALLKATGRREPAGDPRAAIPFTEWTPLLGVEIDRERSRGLDVGVPWPGAGHVAVVWLVPPRA